MWELLVTKTDEKTNKPVIGMGENLARLLIAGYGGHFLRMIEALILLKLKKENFSLVNGLNPISQSITMVLTRFPIEGLGYLRQMAESGFAPVSNERDPAVEMIVKSNIGGVVSRENSRTVGLPNTIWKDNCSRGLIPASESARNEIAIEVLYAERQRWW